MNAGAMMSEWNVIGHGHHIAAWIAIFSGAIVLLSRKGTRWHRRWGWIYIGSMVAMNLSALMIYRLFGVFGVFHYFAIASLLTVGAALATVRMRKPKGAWVEAHANLMAWSYIGLVAAAASEATTRVPQVATWVRHVAETLNLFGGDFGFIVGATSLLVALMGGVFVALLMPRALAPYRSRGARGK